MFKLMFLNSIKIIGRKYSQIPIEKEIKLIGALQNKFRVNYFTQTSIEKRRDLFFSPRSISIIETPFNPLIPLKEIIDFPISNKIIENPRLNILQEIGDDLSRKLEITDPIENNKNDGIQAARLIVIRRRKMKKHKLKKLRQKMKFEWAKVRQRREMRKEKAFQAGLISQIKEAEKFSAEKYVADKLQKASEVPLPRFWKGKRLPQFIIKEKLGIK